VAVRFWPLRFHGCSTSQDYPRPTFHTSLWSVALLKLSGVLGEFSLLVPLWRLGRLCTAAAALDRDNDIRDLVSRDGRQAMSFKDFWFSRLMWIEAMQKGRVSTTP
jgi:hypothetical protein